MKDQILLILALFSLLLTDAQNYSIPDPNFEQALIDLNLDRTSSTDQIDGVAELSIAQSVIDLDVSFNNINDLSGIENFSSLEILRASNNNLTGIDLSSNLLLEDLFLNGNNLTMLDISTLANLDTVWCQSNNITDLDLPTGSALRRLECQFNNLAEIDLSDQPSLERLYIQHNDLTVLDVNECPLLEELDAFDNNIDILKLQGAVLLEDIHVRNNSISDLNLDAQTQLRRLNIEFNDLHNLSVKNGHNNTWSFNHSYTALNNPDLTCISVDDPASSTSDWTAIDSQTSFSTGCVSGNDTCDIAIPITLAQDTPGSTTSATGSALNPACQQNGITIFDVWYQFPAPASGSVTMTLGAQPLIGKIALYDDCTATVPMACAQDELIVNNLTGGQTYYLQVWLEAAGSSQPSSDSVLNVNDAFELRVDDTTTLGVEVPAFAKAELHIYPNPANQQIDIKSSAAMEGVEILNLAGRSIIKKSPDHPFNVSVDTSELNTGLYLVRVTSGDKQLTKKLIIKK